MDTSSTQLGSKLRPCPFCGLKADIDHVPLREDEPDLPSTEPEVIHVISCVNCDVGFIGETHAEVAEKWNRRS